MSMYVYINELDLLLSRDTTSSAESTQSARTMIICDFFSFFLGTHHEHVRVHL